MLYFKQVRIAFLKACMTYQSISSKACISNLSCVYVALGPKKIQIDYHPKLTILRKFHTKGYRLAATITFKNTFKNYQLFINTL